MDPDANIWTRGDANGECRRLHSEELRSLYRSSNIVRVIKSRRLGHVARMEAGRSVFKILSGGPTHTGKIPLRRLRDRKSVV